MPVPRAACPAPARATDDGRHRAARTGRTVRAVAGAGRLVTLGALLVLSAAACVVAGGPPTDHGVTVTVTFDRGR